MGLRSWLTPVTDKKQWQEVLSSINANRYSNGIHYVVKIDKKEGTPFPIGSIVVAWSADGSSSIKELEPKVCRDNSWLLDNFLEDFPEWHTEPGGPAKFGTILTTDNEVISILSG